MTTAAGPIALLGSGEFEPWTAELDRELLRQATSGDGSVAIVPTASAPEGRTFDEWARRGLEHYARLGVPARIVDLRSRGDADREDVVRSLDRSSLIFFSGGNPAFLSLTLAGSRFWETVVERLHEGAAFAGCSGGACIAGSFAPESMTESVWEEHWQPGLELVPDVWVLPHFDRLDGHRPGLREYFLSRVPETGWALGIDERTAALRLGEAWTVVGEGGVLLGRGRLARRFASGESFTFADLEHGEGVDRDLMLAIEPLPVGAGPVGFLSSEQFSPASEEVDRGLLEICGPRVGLVLEADPSNAGHLDEEATAHYRSLGAEPIRLGPEDDPGEVDCLFLAGGDPRQLVPALQGSGLWSGALRRWREGSLGLVGSSAGAMALCERCLFADEGEELPIRWGVGLGPLRSFAVAVHAATRPENWLEEVVSKAEVDVIAMDDGCGIVLQPGAAPVVTGLGRVLRHPAGATASTARPLASPAEVELGRRVRLYHRTAAVREILRTGFMDSLENGSRDGAWEGSWFSDVPLPSDEGADGDDVLVIDVPAHVAERFRWADPEKPYREYVLPRRVANRYGPPHILSSDGTLREAEPQILALGEPVWGADGPKR